MTAWTEPRSKPISRREMLAQLCNRTHRPLHRGATGVHAHFADPSARSGHSEFHLESTAPTERILLPLRGHEHWPTGIQFRSVVDRYFDPAVRRAHLPAIFSGSADPKSGRADLPACELAVDAEWRHHVLPGLDAGERLPYLPVGHLQRADDDLPAGHWLANVPSPGKFVERLRTSIHLISGIFLHSGNAPLFIHQYSHAWFDFRNKQDAYANYFNNSITATQAHKAFCLSLASQFRDYQNNLWGITASDSQNNGYVAWGGPPSMGPIDGSVPGAAGGSVPFVSPDCIAVLRNTKTAYPSAWQRYSFVDAFNPLTGWYDTDALGIDLGIATLMAENYRTAFVWNTFMKNPEPQAAMTAVGFK